jgi:hypothetical protein
MASDGEVRTSRRGGIKRRPTSDKDLSGDRAVVLKTTGKIATTPTGSKTRNPAVNAVSTPGGGLAPVRQRGRAAVARKTGQSA